MIPTYLERLIHEGKAEHKTFSGAVAENLILSIPDKTYAIIYEYWYKPLLSDLGSIAQPSAPLSQTINAAEFIQFVNFFNAEGFNSYWHEVNPDYVVKSQTLFALENPTISGSPFYMPATQQTDYRSCYIKTSRDLSIYFTQLNVDDLTLTSGAVPAIDPLNSWFGYADPLLFITQLIANYHNTGLLGNYEPLQDFITKQIIPAAVPNFVNQVYTIPFYGGSITSPAAYAGAGTSALGKARAQHFQCNYVLINAENPKNLI